MEMGSKIVKLAEVKPNKDVIHYLEELLADAKKGEIQEFLCVALGTEASVHCCYAGWPSAPYTMYGALTAETHEYAVRNIPSFASV